MQGAHVMNLITSPWLPYTAADGAHPPETPAGVLDRDRGKPRSRAKPRQILQAHRAFEKRIFGVKAEVDESRFACHGPTLAQQPTERNGPLTRIGIKGALGSFLRPETPNLPQNACQR